MTFAHPSWLWLLLLAPILLLGKVWADVRADMTVVEFVAPRLRDVLVLGESKGRTWVIYSLQLLALVCFIVALCRPQWGEEKRELRESGRNIIIAIDTSRSMLATDVSPDRLTRAKLAAQDLLTSLPGDRVGVIAFAGQAYLQAPLTTDHDAVSEAIQSLDTTSVPQGGTDITKALRIAVETVEKSPARNHGLIIFSDGGEPVPAVPHYAKQAAEKHILVLAVGVGTEQGSLIPDPDPSRPGDFIRDPKGNVVQSKLESGILQQIATETGGRYLKLGSQPITHALVSDILVALDRQQETSKEERKPIERFRWPLSLGIFLLMTAWLIRPRERARRLTPAVALFMTFVFAPQSGFAASGGGSLLGSIFQRKEVQQSEEAKEAYTGGFFEKARDAYARLLNDKPPAGEKAEIAYGLGASAHQLKDYDRAVDAFSDALESPDSSMQNRAHQGLAHALYDQGDRVLAKQPQFAIRAWTDAIRHFDAALALHDDADARENRDFVKKRLEELKQQEEEKKQQQQQKKKGGKKDGQQGQGKEGDESEEEGEKGEKGKEGKDSKDKQQQGQKGDEEGKKDKGGKGEDQEGKEGKGKEQLPEGQIAAGQGGEKPDKEAEQKEQREMAEAERNETTGFSRNEARAFLRTYADDQKTAQLRQQRRETPNGRDW